MDAIGQNAGRRRKVALALLFLLGLPALTEGLLRIAGFEHYPAVIPMILWNAKEDRNLKRGIGMFVEDRAQLWVPQPGVEVPYGDPDGERINAAGYRGPERAATAPAGVLRIVALGDSSTFGMGVRYPQTWCAQLEAQLTAQGLPAEVIDAGVIGFTIEQGLERYDALARGLSPDIVIAAFGAINEHFWALSLADREKIAVRKQPKPVQRSLSALRTNVRLLHLAGWVIDLARGQDRLAMLEIMKKWRREQDEFNSHAGEVDWPGVRRVGLERFGKALDELDARVRADGARLILISMPRNPGQEELTPVLPLYNQAVEAAAARLEAGFLDARSAVLETLRGPPERDWLELFLDAYHPTAEGHRLIASGLLPIVTRLAAEPRANSRASSR